MMVNILLAFFFVAGTRFTDAAQFSDGDHYQACSDLYDKISPRQKTGALTLVLAGISWYLVSFQSPREESMDAEMLYQQMNTLLDNGSYIEASNLLNSHKTLLSEWSPEELDQYDKALENTRNDLFKMHDTVDNSLIYCYVKGPAHRKISNFEQSIEAMKKIISSHLS
jgi:tetratricopeptide (TPR) repeat protein